MQAQKEQQTSQCVSFTFILLLWHYKCQATIQVLPMDKYHIVERAGMDANHLAVGSGSKKQIGSAIGRFNSSCLSV